MLKKEHLAEIFQVAIPTVEKIIRSEGFPRFKHVAARYPRDEVYEWIKQNTEHMNTTLGVYLDFDESKRAFR
ncbi:helix-turn-helix domain-containing protein [Sporosarcina sp. Te-1]|uniref:helix-turn-helix domain-containing protein n=1 Tax=Sporosarcina sp. Te-1 TaxID=2818390 RepID=UPI001A9F8FBD|nr:helix-turn-helix domain-containing protein [Sporosarcina sp. Te-1]QTD41947.1 helix-turn-helix domain-containing protein [Sporosarcina sp. Te-1]